MNGTIYFTELSTVFFLILLNIRLGAIMGLTIVPNGTIIESLKVIIQGALQHLQSHFQHQNRVFSLNFAATAKNEKQERASFVLQ